MWRPQAATISQRLIASLGLAFALLFFPGGASPQATSLSPQELFKRLASSVFVVEALSAEGSVVAFGSGVAVASDQVVTNRHVIAEGISLRVRQGNRTWPAVVTHLDADHDLCRLKAEGLNASPVGVRRSSSLQVGERVYAMGAPEGLELTLSEGLVSGLRDDEGVRIIQTTAPVSAGSSGGGLFDAQGQLIGITTFIVAEGQNLNFALPGDWVLALDRHEISATRKARADSAEFRALVWLFRGNQAYDGGEHEQAVQAYRESIRLKPDFAEAWYNLGFAYAKLGQYQQAVNPYREAIRLKPDDALAWYNLGNAYARLGQYQEAVQANREAIRLKQDDAEAWTNLGVAYFQLGQHQQAVQAYQEAIRLKPDIAPTWYNLGLAHARQGNRSKVMQVYQRLKTLDPEMADKFFREVVLP
jgi:Flp pilus assembly protein TadD